MFIELIWSNQPSLSSMIIPKNLQHSFLMKFVLKLNVAAPEIIRGFRQFKST